VAAGLRAHGQSGGLEGTTELCPFFLVGEYFFLAPKWNLSLTNSAPRPIGCFIPL